MPQTDETSHVLSCLEIWGGNQAVSTALQMPGLDVWLFSRPDGGAEGGGDVHYASSCASGALSRILLADVAGHGASVAQIATRLRNLMRRHVNHHKQNRFVAAMNREFTELSQAGKFATAVAVAYDAPVNRLHLCVAGHPSPLIYRQREKRWSYLEPPAQQTGMNIPLGIDDVADYDEFEAAADFDDVILCYTDALVEACVSGERFDSARLLAFMQQIQPTDPSRLIENIVQGIESSGAFEDDVTLLLMRLNGKRKRIPFHDRLLAPIRVIASLFQPSRPSAISHVGV
jgi:serine phosphatase RsbU (regulator of sigma subunit)